MGVIDSRILQELRKIYEQNPLARALCRLPAVRASHRRETSVDWALSLLRQHGSPASRSEVVRVFKDLDKAGAGKFVVGRKSGVSRFVWNYPPAELIRAALPSLGSSGTTEITGISLDPKVGSETRRYGLVAPLQLGVESEAPQGDQTVLVPHSFQLRPGLLVMFELPIDLTQTEAQRLCSFIASLPFGPEKT
jgi:hypothetical protein